MEESRAGFLARLGIPLEASYNIFFNSRLLVSRSKTACWVRYPQVHKDSLDWKLDIPFKQGDRIGLFAKDMAVLVF